MDGLAPPLRLCLNLRYALENGGALYSAVKSQLIYLDESLRIDLSVVLAAHEQGRAATGSDFISKSEYRKALIEIIMAGLRGEPIVKQLRDIEDEIKAACEYDLEMFIARLPMKALVPLMLVQFPAFLILVLGPVLNQLIKGLAQ
jgi:hypothetical protein